MRSHNRHVLPLQMTVGFTSTHKKLRSASTPAVRTASFARPDSSQLKSLLTWRNVRELRSAPTPALLLGLGGLIPFTMAPWMMLSSGVYSPTLVDMQIKYAATILAFLGGPRWGITLSEVASEEPDWGNLGYGVMLPLVAWISILLPGELLPLLTLISGLTAACYCDLALPGYPPWYKALRSVLTLVAVLSLWTTLVLKAMPRKATDSAKGEAEPTADLTLVEEEKTPENED